MYRLVLYYLIFLLGIATLFAWAGILPYDPFALLFTIGIEVAVCAITNAIFAKAFAVPANTESTYISALILALIITPFQSTHDLWFLGWSAALAMASKYTVAINRKHLFNPIAFAVALTYLTINQSASWWVGDAAMLPFVLVGGILIVRKIRRFDLVASFLLSAFATILTLSVINRAPIITTLQQTLVYSPLLFFAFVIITEPLTTPPARRSQIYYGMLVGVLFAPQFHIGAFYTTPELAILIGNLFAYVVSPKASFMLRLKEKVQLAPDIYDFIFVPARKFAFAPGQYMEWTLGHNEPDNRGNRRYFTLASSPTEDTLRLGVKFYQQSSSFKSALLAMEAHSEIVAAQVAGDFVLPDDPRQRCVFIAGGIGITPFRSMITYLLDTHQRRPIVMFYTNRTAGDIVYKDVFDRAGQELGIKTIYTITDTQQRPQADNARVGYLSPQLIKDEVPDYLDCIFYISGPPAMVDSFKAALRQIHVKNSQIKTDFFAGLA
jgi:ferredoxin-NADP reductase/Na+-translocating ferredoxin:NAD+ oxidoreductase RnfD subunit